LVAYALEHAQGTCGHLFKPWSNVRWDLHAAASPEFIAPVMGHADTRMVERVYGRLPLEDLRRRLAQAMGVDCSTIATAPAETGGFGGLPVRVGLCADAGSSVNLGDSTIPEDTEAHAPTSHRLSSNEGCGVAER